MMQLQRERIPRADCATLNRWTLTLTNRSFRTSAWTPSSKSRGPGQSGTCRRSEASSPQNIYQPYRMTPTRLKADKKINKLDNIAVRSVDITEAWQEQGQDYVTVRFYANLLDYVVDENSGQVVSGSKTDPVKFEEYWTFTRSVGNNAWQLSAITQPS